MDRPTQGVALGGVIAGVGAACQAVADRLAAGGRLQPSIWLERGGRLRCVAGTGFGDGAAATGAAAGHGMGIVQTTFAGGVETVVPDLGRGPAIDTAPGRVAPGAFRARACLAIRSRDGRVLGVLDVRLREPIVPPTSTSCATRRRTLAARIAAARSRSAEPAAQRMLRHVAGLSGLPSPT